MPKIELTILVAVALIFSFLVGWVVSRITQNMNHIKNLNESEINELNKNLLEAEEERDQTIAYIKSRERELTNQLGQAKAELNAAMEGLGAARREASELRKKLNMD